jgi:hypothetical protein
MNRKVRLLARLTRTSARIEFVHVSLVAVDSHFYFRFFGNSEARSNNSDGVIYLACRGLFVRINSARDQFLQEGNYSFHKKFELA